MRVFHHVVAENGFAACSRKLGLLPATVSRLVRDLEDDLGVQLLQRTTRRLALTSAGEAYLVRVGRILDDIADADEVARSHAHELTGSVRVGALPGVATHFVAPAIAEFRRRHPGVTIELHTDALAARDIEGHDITLVTDHEQLPGEAVVRPVIRSESVFCASPDYVKRHGEPSEPQDLPRHDMIRIVAAGISSGPLRLLHESEAERTEVVRCHPALSCNDHETALRSTLEGAGISSQAVQVAAPLLRSGLLRRVLAPWLSDRFTLLASFPSRRHMPARTRAFIDHLVRHAAQVAPAGDAAAVAGA
jgi:DNA-binding transcriptional LysR family regulator